jgi:glycerol-3-phosphate O-acyltransferase
MIFAYGVMKFALGNEIERVPVSKQYANDAKMDLNLQFHKIDERLLHKQPSTPIDLLLPDISLLSERFLFNPNPPVPYRELLAVCQQVLEAPSVVDAIEKYSEKEGISLAQAHGEAKQIFDRMIGKTNPAMFLSVSMILRKAFRRLYTSVFVNHRAMEKLSALNGDTPVIYLPTHRSCLDSVLIAFLTQMFRVAAPIFASGHDQVEAFLCKQLFVHWGAFLVSKGVWEEDDLEFVILSAFICKLLARGQSVEFFVETECSKSALMQPTQSLMISHILKSYLKGDVPDAVVCPVTINYEKTVEYEWEENRFPTGGTLNFILKNFARSFTKLSSDLGRISVRFSDQMLSLKTLYQQFESQNLKSEGLLQPKALPEFVTTFVVRQLTHNIECMPTHIVASLLLANRRGLKRQDLASQSDWLCKQIKSRGGRICFFEGECWSNIIDRALYHLRKVINERKENLVSPFAQKSADLQDMLLLSKYRNHLLYLFLEEALHAVAFYSFNSQYQDSKVQKTEFIGRCEFLRFLFDAELRCLLKGHSFKEVSETFVMLKERGVFDETQDGLISVRPSGDSLFSFLCSMCWPLLDCYYVVACSLFKLKSSRTMQDILLLSEAQTLGIVCFVSLLSAYL